MLPPGCRFAVCHGPGSQVPLICYQPPSQLFSVSLVALCEFADERAGLVSTIGHPYLSLILKIDDRFSDFERLQQARLCEEHQGRCRGPSNICEVPSKPSGYNRMTVASNSHSKTSAMPVLYLWWTAPLMATRVMRWVGCPNRSK